MMPHSFTRARAGDDRDARIARLLDRLLDGLEAALAELTSPLPVTGGAIDRARLGEAIRRAMRSECAVLLCRHARCRRAGVCRGRPCAVLAEPQEPSL